MLENPGFYETVRKADFAVHLLHKIYCRKEKDYPVSVIGKADASLWNQNYIAAFKDDILFEIFSFLYITIPERY